MNRRSSVMQSMPSLRNVILVLFIAGWNTIGLGFGQTLEELNVSMSTLAPLIRYAPTDPERYAANDKFTHLLDDALRLDDRMRHKWDSLEGISILTSPDQRFRIFSWFIPLSNGTFEYFGVIQSFNERQKRYIAHWLTDQSGHIKQAEQALLDANNWFGVLYYDLIPVSTPNNTYYTLLGWDGHDLLSTRKIIEILTFRANGTPVFGYYLFRKRNQKNRRIIFEYSARSTMMLRYDRQSYNEKIRKKGKGVTEKKIQQDMIVFDRLMPMHPSMEGQFAFYVPETNIVDAFIFQDGRWNYYANIDARNPVIKGRKQPKRPTNLELFPQQ